MLMLLFDLKFEGFQNDESIMSSVMVPCPGMLLLYRSL